MIYLELFIAFLKVGCFSFGGAYAAIPLIRDVVTSYGWIGDEQLSYMIAVSESTPGPVMVNTATYIGSSQGGLLGAAISTFAVVLPAFIIILLISLVFKKILGNKYVISALDGLKACVTGVILAVGIQMTVKAVFMKNGNFVFVWQPFVIFIILALLLFGIKYILKKKFSPIAFIGISAVLGAVIYAI